jgi:hypothetical protein
MKQRCPDPFFAIGEANSRLADDFFTSSFRGQFCPKGVGNFAPAWGKEGEMAWQAIFSITYYIQTYYDFAPPWEWELL